MNSRYPSFLEQLGLDCPAAGASGAVITDLKGRQYIDCVGGYGVFNLGHNHPAIVAALIEQLGSGQLTTRPLLTDVQVRFAEMLNSIAPGDLCHSCLLNSGSEAIDYAIKLVRLMTGRPEIITARGSFHGHTLGALSASGIPSFRREFEPLIPGFVAAAYGDADEIERSVSDRTAAVLIEPMQHEAGIILPPNGYLRAVREICDRHNLLFVLDEVKTGMGKTGRFFACEHEDVQPDVLCLGKSLGAGLIPVGAVMTDSASWRRSSLSFSMTASSYAGNALACRVGIEVIRCLQQEDLVAQCAHKGEYLIGRLRRCCAEYPDLLQAASGLGLLLGLECRSVKIARQLTRAMIRTGVLVMMAFGNARAIMIEPPLVISMEQLELVVDALRRACETNASQL